MRTVIHGAGTILIVEVTLCMGMYVTSRIRIARMFYSNMCAVP